jgi:ferritin-like metal-binding protein YciE
MSLATMQDLLLHELRDLHHAEGQLLRALPDLAAKARNHALVATLARHLNETEQHEVRLEQCFQLLGVPARDERCRGMEGLLAETRELTDGADTQEVRDAAIISACQKIEHYEISGYGTARAFAESLGLPEVATLLGETLEEEALTNERLTEIAESEVNLEAIETNGHGIGTDRTSRPASQGGSESGMTRH